MLGVISAVTRVELIDGNGRVAVRRLGDAEELTYSLQDDGRTLKLFIGPKQRPDSSAG